MNNPAHSAALKKRSLLNLTEVQTLLELINDAAVLVDVPSGLVLQTNAKAVELTAYTRFELTNLHLVDLFPELAGSELRSLNVPVWQPGDENERRATLTRHGGSKLEAEIKFTPLDTPKGHWLLLTFEPSTRRQLRSAEKHQVASMWEAMNALVSAADFSDPETAFENLLQAGRILTGTDILALYLLGKLEAGGASNQPGETPAPTLAIHRVYSVGPAELLPDEIDLHAVNTLRQPVIWQPGKRAQSGLHQAALAAHLTCVASAPLGPARALIGLVVAANTHIPPTRQLLKATETLAAYIARSIQSYALIQALRNELKTQRSTIHLGLAIKEAVQEGIILVAPDMTILEMNLFAESMLGYTSREVVGHPLEDIIISEENIYATIVSTRMARSQEESRSESERSSLAIYPQILGNAILYRRDGRPILTQLRLLDMAPSRQPGGTGETQPWVILIQDLSQEEQFRLRTQQLEQRALLGEVTAVFAHEVRNPINNISTGLQLMALNLPSTDPNQELIGRLQQDCDRLAELMKSVLAFARPKEYKLEPVKLSALLQRLLERWNPRLARANIQHHAQFEETLPFVMADPRAIEQVFNNLIANASQAMATKETAQTNEETAARPASVGGVLTIKTRMIPAEDESGPFVETSVSDTGLGIPDEIRERIFEPFFTTHPGGTGLGLAITKQIITAHRGSIAVTSVPGGTVFSVRLPAGRAGRAIPDEPGEAAVN